MMYVCHHHTYSLDHLMMCITWFISHSMVNTSHSSTLNDMCYDILYSVDHSVSSYHSIADISHSHQHSQWYVLRGIFYSIDHSVSSTHSIADISHSHMIQLTNKYVYITDREESWRERQHILRWHRCLRCIMSLWESQRRERFSTSFFLKSVDSVSWNTLPYRKFWAQYVLVFLFCDKSTQT